MHKEELFRISTLHIVREHKQGSLNGKRPDMVTTGAIIISIETL
jgi:hypothetical protein